MPRIPRHLLVEEGSTNHCTWRSHNFSLVLESDAALEESEAELDAGKGVAEDGLWARLRAVG